MLAGLAATAPARAEAVSADTAQHLQQQLHDWLAGLLGPSIDVGEPFRVTPEGDHFGLTFNPAKAFSEALGWNIEGDPLIAKLVPLPGRRWQIDQSQKNMSAHGTPLPSAAGKPATGNIEVTFGSEDQHATLDPSLATPSGTDVRIKDYHITMSGVGTAGMRTTAADELHSRLGWKPVADGRLDVFQVSDADRLATRTMMPNLGPISVAIERTHTDLHLGGIAPGKLAAMMRAGVTLWPVAMAASQAANANNAAIQALATRNREAAAADKRAAEEDRQAVTAGTITQAEFQQRVQERRTAAQARLKAIQVQQASAFANMPPMTPEQKTAAQDMIKALPDLLDSVNQEGSAENVVFVGFGKTWRLDKLAGGFAAAAPDGHLQTHINMAFDGFNSPDIPAGVFRDDLPRHFSIALSAGGLPSTELRSLLLQAADNNGADPHLREQLQALLTKGPMTIGLTDFKLDIGVAMLKGRGEIRLDAQHKPEGHMRFVAAGFDALIKQASGAPELASIAPVLYLLKGVGKDDGSTTLWDVTFHDGKILVNGADVAGLMKPK
jgi:hypothetical protein